MKKIIYILVFLTFPQIGIAQLYKCDSAFVSIDNKINGGFKNGLRHGTWTFSDDTMHYNITKIEDYWFGELVRTRNSLTYYLGNFEKNDTIIEYFFGPTIKFVLSQVIIPDSEYYYFCELSKSCDSITTLIFQKLLITNEESKVKNFCSLTNRYIVLDSINIPVISESDREFANLGWSFTGCYYLITIDKYNRITKTIKYGW